MLRILYRSLLSDKNLGIDTHFAGELLFSVAVYLEEIIWRIHKYLVERRKKTRVIYCAFEKHNQLRIELNSRRNVYNAKGVHSGDWRSGECIYYALLIEIS